MVKSEQFAVRGMTCENCVRHVEVALRRVVGVSTATVDLRKQEARIDYDPAVATVNAITSVVNEAGYTLAQVKEPTRRASPQISDMGCSYYFGRSW